MAAKLYESAGAPGAAPGAGNGAPGGAPDAAPGGKKSDVIDAEFEETN